MQISCFHLLKFSIHTHPQQHCCFQWPTFCVTTHKWLPSQPAPGRPRSICKTSIPVWHNIRLSGTYSWVRGRPTWTLTWKLTLEWGKQTLKHLQVVLEISTGGRKVQRLAFPSRVSQTNFTDGFQYFPREQTRGLECMGSYLTGYVTLETT